MSKGPLIVFDYFFYRITSFYKENFGDKNRLYGVSILSIIQCQNILALLGLGYIILHKANELSPVAMIVIGTIIPLIYNIIRYYRMLPYKELEVVWNEEERIIRKRRGYYLFLYIILSFIASVVIVSISRSA